MQSVSSNQLYKKLAIALVVFAASVAFAWFKMDTHYDERKEFIPVIQFVATVGLLFGNLKAPREHKSVFMLFWLVCTLIFWVILLICGCDLLVYHWGYFKPLTVVVVTSSVVVPFLEYIMYNIYVEQTLDIV